MSIFNDEQRRFSVPHVAYLYELSSGPSVPFAMGPAFPDPDYYEDSVAVGLAPREAIPSFPIIVRTSMG